jgi:hypothetical protein
MIQASILLLSALISSLKFRRELVLENLALRQQLAIYKRRHPDPTFNRQIACFGSGWQRSGRAGGQPF